MPSPDEMLNTFNELKGREDWQETSELLNVILNLLWELGDKRKSLAKYVRVFKINKLKIEISYCEENRK